MRTFFALLLAVVSLCLSVPVDAQDRLLAGYEWYGDSANVHNTQNVWFVDSLSADIAPYSRIEFHCQYNNIDTIGVWCSIPGFTQIEITVERLAGTIEVIGRLTGPLPYGRYTVPFHNPFNAQAKYASVEAPVLIDGTGDFNNGIAFIDAAFVTLSTMYVNSPEIPDSSTCKDYLQVQPEIFYNILGQRVPRSPIYKDLGNGRALVR